MTVWEPPTSISPSRLANFFGCPLRFRIETIQKLRGGTSAAAVQGTCIHAALELLMQLEPEHRTPAALDGFVEEALVAIRQTEDYLSLTEEQLKGFDARVRRVAPRVFDIMSPSEVAVAGIELRLEVEVEGWTLRGIIDLLEDVDGGKRVRDYKAGRAPSERFQAKAMLGLDCYAVMVDEAFGAPPVEVDLLYLDPRLRIHKRVTPMQVKATRNKIRAAREAVERACETDTFRANRSALCDWCSAKPYCPEFGGDPDSVPVQVREVSIEEVDEDG